MFHLRYRSYKVVTKLQSTLMRKKKNTCKIIFQNQMYVIINSLCLHSVMHFVFAFLYYLSVSIIIYLQICFHVAHNFYVFYRSTNVEPFLYFIYIVNLSCFHVFMLSLLFRYSSKFGYFMILTSIPCSWYMFASYLCRWCFDPFPRKGQR